MRVATARSIKCYALRAEKGVKNELTKFMIILIISDVHSNNNIKVTVSLVILND